MGYITTRDGTKIFYKDWGSGPAVILAHGWPLNADAWEGQMLFLAQNGYRAIAHDRRGHGRSSQTSSGNNMDTYADDLAELIEQLDLDKVALVGHSTGGGEVTRYIGRHGTGRVSKAVLIAAVPPLMVSSESNPDGIPIEAFDQLRTSIRADRAQFFKDFALMFFGANRAGSAVSSGTLEQFWRLSMQAGMKNVYQCVEAFSETDFTSDLKRFSIPTLLIHVDDDQIAPIRTTSMKTAQIISNVKTVYYPGAPHGITSTHQEQVNSDILSFLAD